MFTKRAAGAAALTAMAFALAQPASATDGHFLHGVGAVNSALGGAGIAAPGDLMGSMYLNPAGLTTIPGTHVAFGFEMFKPTRSVESALPGFGSGVTESKSEFVPIPSFGISAKMGDRWTVGVAGLGIGGFGVDYPSTPTNPILGPRPAGFGQVYSNFSLMKIMPAAAVQATDKLSLGVAFNLDWATLSVDPMPIGAPIVTQGQRGPQAYYSRATAADGAFGIGMQAGLLYQATDYLALGLAYTSPQLFQDFEFNSMDENPNSTGFGHSREITFAMDVPAVYGAGAALELGDAVLLSTDARYITYSRTDGFSEAGFNPDFSVAGFGWDDIFVGAVGLQVSPSQSWAVRGGYNYSQNPIPHEWAAINLPAPAIVQHHITGGFGFRADGGLGVDVAVYHAFENDCHGPFDTPFGTMDVTSRLAETSLLLQFSFAHSN